MRWMGQHNVTLKHKRPLCVLCVFRYCRGCMLMVNNFHSKKKKNLFNVTLPRVSWFHSWWNSPNLLMPGVSVTATSALLVAHTQIILVLPAGWAEGFLFFSLHQMKPPQICSFGSKAAFGTIRFDCFLFCFFCCRPSSQTPNIGFTVPGRFVVCSFRETPVSERYKDDEWEHRELLILASEWQLLHKLEVCLCQNGGLTQSVLLQPFLRLGTLDLSSQMSDFGLFFLRIFLVETLNSLTN